jgi:predicted DNA-binding protein
MTISIRLDPDTENSLRRHLAAAGTPLSTFVREAIRDKLARVEEPPTPYLAGEALFGRHASGDTDRSVRRKALIRERIHAKHRR